MTNAPGEPRPAVLILGASTRAAAQSAVRAGLRPICADLFADEDLRAVAADVLPVEDYPRGLPAAARLAPACPWMYTGALENHPAIVEKIAADRPLWGNPADVVRRVRDPLWLENVLRAAGLPAAEVRAGDDPPAADGGWLLKPLRGAAGRGIVVWDEGAGRSKTLGEPHYFQRWIAGGMIGGLYVAWPGGTELVGISRQLGETCADGRASFRYCGSEGPVRLIRRLTEQVRAAGGLVAREAGLRGLFGIDFVHDGRDACAVEVNPRYTASVEVHELATGVALLDHHRRACEAFVAPADRVSAADALRRAGRAAPDREAVVRKAILYAQDDLVVPALEEVVPPLGAGRFPALADIPRAGSRVARGQPICTVLTKGRRSADVGGPMSALLRALRSGSPSADCS